MAHLLGQCVPAAATPTTLYTATGGMALSGFSVCNRGASPATFGLAIAGHYLYSGKSLDAHRTFFDYHCILPIGVGDVVECTASTPDLTFQIFGAPAMPAEVVHTNVIGQCAPEANTLTDFCLAQLGAEIRGIAICNRGASPATCRLAIAPGAAADDPAHYLYYDKPLAAHATYFDHHCNMPLGVGDVLRCYASTADLTFQIFGVGGIAIAPLPPVGGLLTLTPVFFGAIHQVGGDWVQWDNETFPYVAWGTMSDNTFVGSQRYLQWDEQRANYDIVYEIAGPPGLPYGHIELTLTLSSLAGGEPAAAGVGLDDPSSYSPVFGAFTPDAYLYAGVTFNDRGAACGGNAPPVTRTLIGYSFMPTFPVYMRLRCYTVGHVLPDCSNIGNPESESGHIGYNVTIDSVDWVAEP